MIDDDTFQKLTSDSIMEIKEMIGVLEKKVAGIIEYNSNIDVNIHGDLWKEIAELKADYKKIAVLNIQRDRERKELKEQLSTTHRIHLDSHSLIREVLRELGEEIKAFRDDEGYGTYSVEKILAKLSGETQKKEVPADMADLDELERRSEKKELNDTEIYNDGYIKGYNQSKEDSGGEK